MTTTSRTGRVSLASLFALIAALFAIGIASGAQAEPTGSLTVKALRNGTPGVVSVSGAKFTLTTVNGVDLVTDPRSATEWAKVQAYAKDPSLVAANLGDTVTLAATDSAGVTGLDGLKPGLYRLVLTGPAPDGTTFDPMLVTIPTPVENSSTLNYDVTIEPKPHFVSPSPLPTEELPAPTPAPSGVVNVNSGLPTMAFGSIALGAVIVAFGVLLTMWRRSAREH